MAICSSVQTILPQQCIGDSLPIINTNFSNLNTDVCTLLTLINELSSNMNKFNLPYAKFVEPALIGVDGANQVSQGLGTFIRILNAVDINDVDTGIILNPISGIMTVPAGAYEVRLSMGGVIAQNANPAANSSGTAYGLALKEVGIPNYVFRGLQRLCLPYNESIYIQEGKIFLNTQTQLQLCLRVGGANPNPILNVASGTLDGGAGLFTVEFWKLT